MFEEPLAAGDRLLMTTDGVHGVLDVRASSNLPIRTILRPRLRHLRAAIAQGSRDNCTAIVAQ